MKNIDKLEQLFKDLKINYDRFGNTLSIQTISGTYAIDSTFNFCAQGKNCDFELNFDLNG